MGHRGGGHGPGLLPLLVSRGLPHTEARSSTIQHNRGDQSTGGVSSQLDASAKPVPRQCQARSGEGRMTGGFPVPGQGTVTQGQGGERGSEATLGLGVQAVRLR